MELYRCPKGKKPMDESQLSFSGATAAYVSQKQTGMVRKPTSIQRAHACPNCGFVELYLDPRELKTKIS